MAPSLRAIYGATAILEPMQGGTYFDSDIYRIKQLNFDSDLLHIEQLNFGT